MIITLPQNRISEKFSKAAVRYEELSGLQQSIGVKLLERIENKENVGEILDIGMGTGWLTEKLISKFPKAHVTGIDFAFGMVDHAKKKNPALGIAQANACFLPFKKDVFERVISNLTYQWVFDLPMAFGQVFRILKHDGDFFFSSFGPKTLSELFLSIEKSVHEKNKAGAGRKLTGEEEITDALFKSGFKHVDVSSEVYKVYFHDVPSLVWWLKNVGANGMKWNVYFGKELLFRMDQYYRRHFYEKGKIYATFEVIWARTKKPAAINR